MNWANGAQTTLVGAITAGAIQLTVASAALFPAAPFHINIDKELMTVTVVAGTTWTITRAIEGSIAAAHASGSLVTCCFTAGDAASFGTGSGDMLAALVMAPVAITNASTNLTEYAWNVVKATTMGYVEYLPAPVAGKVVGIRITPDSTKLVTLAPFGMESIDGASSRIMWSGEKAVLLSDGTNWFKVAGVSIPMQCSLHLLASQGSIGSGTETLCHFDIVDSDNTKLMADTTNYRILLRRTSNYTVIASLSFDSDGMNGAWPTTSGCGCFILNNAPPGGPWFATSRGLVIGGTFADPSVPASAIIAGIAGNYIAVSAYMGADNFFLMVASGQTCTFQVIETPSW